MNALASLPAAALLLALGLPADAQQAAQQAAQKAPAASTGSPEPKVQNIVIEDEGSRIEELRVRGVAQRIVVKPKVGAKGVTAPGYEIITGDGSRDLSDGANTSRGAAGKRVWHILSF